MIGGIQEESYENTPLDGLNLVLHLNKPRNAFQGPTAGLYSTGTPIQAQTIRRRRSADFGAAHDSAHALL